MVIKDISTPCEEGVVQGVMCLSQKRVSQEEIDSAPSTAQLFADNRTELVRDILAGCLSYLIDRGELSNAQQRTIRKTVVSILPELV